MTGQEVEGVLTRYSRSPRVNASVAFMGAARYSGSTLLGVMLGGHPLIFYAGEAEKTWNFDNPDVPHERRVCRLCGPGCGVWGDFSVEPGLDLYEMLSRRTKRPIVFDSSKKMWWIKLKVAELQGMVPLRLIVLTRDGRAVVNSDLRKQPGTSAHDHASTWVERMRDVEELASCWPGAVHRVRYEELASRPEFTLRALTDFLGVAFDPAMLDPWASDQHPIGGNPGPLPLLLPSRERANSVGRGVLDTLNFGEKTSDGYGNHFRGIVLDLRWKHEMSADALAVFEAVAGETNRAYAWEESAE
jgi:hypothetical protein